MGLCCQGTGRLCVGEPGTSQRAVGPYGAEALNAWPRSLHTRAIPGLFLERDLVGMWAQPKAHWTTPCPEESQSGPRVYTCQPKADGKEKSQGLWGSLEEQRSGGAARASCGSQGRRPSHPEPSLGHRTAGLSTDQAGSMCSEGTERRCAVKLMRPQGLAPGPAHVAGWHGAQLINTTW